MEPNNVLKTCILIIIIFTCSFIAVRILFFGGQKSRKQERQEEKNSRRQPYVENEKRKEQITLLTALCLQAENAESEVIYSKLFARIGKPVQKLLALAESQTKDKNYEGFLEGEILSPLRNAVQIFQVSFSNNNISLPCGQQKSESQILAKFEKLTDRDLNESIRSCQNRIKYAKKYEIPKGAIIKMSSSLQNLIETPAAELGLPQIQNLAEQIRISLIQSGIYPMYIQDEKLADRPDLRSLFIENRGGYILPGFFIETNHKLQLYGNFQGTFDRNRE